MRTFFATFIIAAFAVLALATPIPIVSTAVSFTGVVESRAGPRYDGRGYALIIGDAEPLRLRQTDGLGHEHPAGGATEFPQSRGDGNGHNEHRRNDGNGHNERRQNDGNGHDERRRNNGNGHNERDEPAQD
ncbi:uncharacterized protein TRAVEDRAFT_17114 [Trametes versicolor FP-101664 SS1]|uniref:uncharacterized protein n=1 Tax=Trametes versicolor (strain FP-101664) TaxID=717944 RepID=UPI0004624839|nr:uncharacterized protein TRAVEDRAFT_17114 [Trametes versicolor FP-101664 SS1]EIW65387.1 hypothetical protein TRAVEDRAFT_17114 [Trametes versicolor FP-101664 SS1]